MRLVPKPTTSAIRGLLARMIWDYPADALPRQVDNHRLFRHYSSTRAASVAPLSLSEPEFEDDPRWPADCSSANVLTIEARAEMKEMQAEILVEGTKTSDWSARVYGRQKFAGAGKS